MSDAPEMATTIELRRLSNETVPDQEAHGNDHSLPPADGGKAAWRLLLVAFVFEALLWGFPLSFGVFQEYYSQLPEFEASPYISIIGTVASGMSYMAAPFIIPVVKRYSKYRRHMIWLGWTIALLGLVAGSFASNLGTLIITQGVMYGFGFIVFYYPILSMVNEYWVVRRGMAYGILCAASGVSGAALPIGLQSLLHRYGYQTTLRIIAIGLLVLTGPLIPALKGRFPHSSTEITAPSRTDWTFLKAPLFWIFSASNFAMGLGYFFPSIYLPSYATSNGMNATQGALLLTVMSISQVLGQFSFGYLSDKNRIPLNFLVSTSALVAGIAVYTCWGLAQTFGVLTVFALLYGFFGAGYTAMWARMGSAVASEPSAAFAAFGLLNFGKGIGNVLAGPIGGALLGTRANVRGGTYAVSKYETIVLFTGSCMLVSAITIGVRYVRCPMILGDR
ncbi:putative major facilitator superfamily, MFS transporter superfamily [Septoria linicola]|nr:putative major facilitator superfamily, MFS transporter superfamily [Septoria linicola]